MSTVEHVAVISVPNMDGMSRSELFEYYTQALDDARKPECAPFKAVLQTAAQYADNKREAMRLRLDGQIDNALRIEARCDRIYDTLPAWAQW